jgi:hypothetical protein
VTAGLVVVDGLVVVVVDGLVVVVVDGLVVVVVGLDGAVVAVVAEVLDAPDEEAEAVALTATFPAINAIGKAIKVTGTRTLSVCEGRRAGRRRACRALEVPSRPLIARRRGTHTHDACRSSLGPLRKSLQCDAPSRFPPDEQPPYSVFQQRCNDYCNWH